VCAIIKKARRNDDVDDAKEEEEEKEMHRIDGDDRGSGILIYDSLSRLLNQLLRSSSALKKRRTGEGEEEGAVAVKKLAPFSSSS
jgi:hypothetical protein